MKEVLGENGGGWGAGRDCSCSGNLFGFSSCGRLTEYNVNARPQNPHGLGDNSSFISDATGYAIQHLQYLPFGETFVDQQNGYDARYTFSAKEKDDETQYSYFGARYYDSDLSVWLSVDPLSNKYPSTSAYMYCLGNPIILVDPNGMSTVGPDGYTIDTQGNIERVDDTGGDDYDVLYRKDDYEAAKTDARINGNKNEYGNPEPSDQLRVNDTRILPELSLNDSEERSITKGYSTGSIDDIFKMFLFATKNSNVEWGLVRYNYNQYALYTNHEYDALDFPDKGMNIPNVFALLHNHNITTDDIWKQWSTMGDQYRPDTKQHQRFSNSDWWSKAKLPMSYEFYCYFSKSNSKRLYHIGNSRITYVKNVHSYRDLYFGVLNHR